MMTAQGWFGLRDGHLIFFSFEGPLHSDAFGGRWHNGENLWTIMTDPLTGKPSGNATKITNWDELFPYSVTASSDGNRLAVVKTHIRDDVYVGELEDGGTTLGLSYASYREREHGQSYADGCATAKPFSFRQTAREEPRYSGNGSNRIPPNP